MLPTPAVAAPKMSLRQAEKMSVRELRTELLGAAGTPYVEAEVQDGGGGPFSGGPHLSSIDFATAPRSAGFAGLCSADTLTVWFAVPRRHSADTRMSVRSVTSDRRFHILDSGDCSDTGPVPTPWRTPMHNGFFSVIKQGSDQIDIVADVTVRALREAKVDGAAGHHAIRCRPDPAKAGDTMCANPARLFAARPWSSLCYVSVGRCPEDFAKQCPEFSVARSNDRRDDDARYHVTVVTDAGPIDLPRGFAVRSITIEGETLVE